MPRQPSAVPGDTTLDVFRRERRAVAEMSTAQRFERVAEINDLLDELEREHIRREHPGSTVRQVFLAQMRRRYDAATFRACWPDAANELPPA